MLDRLARQWFERLGARYQWVFLLTSGPAAVFVALGTVAVLASYYDPTIGEAAIVMGVSAVFTSAAVFFALFRAREDFAKVLEWREKPSPGREETVEAWDVATNLPMRSYRRDSLRVSTIATIPSVLAMILVLDLSWVAVPVLALACVISAGYATVLNYSLTEILLRPAIEEIAAALPDDFVFQRNGLPIRKRLIIGLPVFTALTGLTVAALVTDHGGTGLLTLSVLSSIGVGLALSLELAILLSRAITDPIADLRAALSRVRGGDYDVMVPVVTSDEVGELTDDFNRMVRGLAEREEMREVFGTYLDKDIARFILSGQFPKEGIAIDVSIMFCDVREFTTFAESTDDPKEVVASLNLLFETLVPIVDRHGGHVDKFLGDGLLATFGAPEGYRDHADRAVAAGLEIVHTINHSDHPSGLQVGVGINSGRVIAGSIGGAGRLNFSVIGDPVNVAARVEAATRETGDDLLATAATCEALQRPVEMTSRGSVSLKGKAEPVAVLAPPRAAGAQGREARLKVVDA